MNPQHFQSFESPPLPSADKKERFFRPSCSTFTSNPSFQTNSKLERDFGLPHEEDQRMPQLILGLAHPASCDLAPREPTPITIPSLVDVESLIEKILGEFEDTTDHRKKSTSEFQSLSVPDDMMHLTESFFTPFGLRDSTQVCVYPGSAHSLTAQLLSQQPFIVFKPSFVDQQLLALALQHPEDLDRVCPIREFCVLTASPAFCGLVQYAEVPFPRTFFVGRI